MDQLIPVDDSSQMIDIKNLLDKVRNTAKMVTSTTEKQDKRKESNVNVKKEHLERQKHSEIEPGDDWESKEEEIDIDREGARNVITPTRTHSMKTRSQGSLTKEEAANGVKRYG